MTTMELRTAFLQEVIAIMDGGEETVQKALDNLRHLRKETETIGKKEILSGIAEGLQEMNIRHRNKTKGQTLQELIDEL